ncbi:MAG TPA: YceI family protein [Bacteroidota bacterium]|nr:YceI family protein [Bacteroidota bacterium]
MKRSIGVFLLVAAATWNLFAQIPDAQASGWKLDKSHSKIGFTVKHMVISEVQGYFKDFDITINSSKDDFSDGQAEAVIKVATINTESEGRDKDLRSDNFFNVEQFPEIRFKSTKFEKLGDNIYKIYGDLTIRDTTKQVVFDVVHNGTLKTGRGLMSAWKVTLSINRFDYGLKWNRLMETGGLVVGELVNITMTLELRKAAA